MSEKKPTKAERVMDTVFGLAGSSVAVHAGIKSMQHGWIELASIGFTLAAWLVVCVAIETKRWAS